jgi:hypothetical protein
MVSGFSLLVAGYWCLVSDFDSSNINIPHSDFLNVQSAIRNLQSDIRKPQSSGFFKKLSLSHRVF